VIRDAIIDYVEAHRQEVVDFLVTLIRTRPVNPYFVPGQDLSEAGAQRVIRSKLEDLGLEVLEIPVDFELLQDYKGLPGYMPGITDQVSFEGRPNLLARLPGTDPENAPSILLCGHCDVVAADDAEQWEYPPFEGTVKDGMIYGRGSADMLSGLAGMVYAIEAIVKTGHRPKGDIWFASLVAEEFGGTGALAVAEWMRLKGIKPTVAIMGEPTDAKDISLLCRAISFVDIIVTGRAGHLERTPEHWSEGGAVDAISKARYIMDQLDILNADWALRADKDHPLINDPCQAKVSMIKGGHHPSSYAETCVLTVDIQSLPHEQDENGLPMSVRREFEDFLRRACEADPWLRHNPVEIQWKLDADCAETPQDHEFVQLLVRNVHAENGGGRLFGISGHYDGGWFDKLNGTKVVCFGPGSMRHAHARDEACSVQELVEYTKILAATCFDWC
jgi:acetylornithine deacetylase